MPASFSCVTLDQAKDWSKRLFKTAPSLGSLTQAQQSVAIMLGHASWHALQSYYKNQHEASQEANANDPTSMNSHMATIKTMYPGINPASMELISSQVDTIGGSAADFLELAGQIEDEEGVFFSDAVERALDKQACPLLIPPKHFLAKVFDDKGQRTMVLLPHRN